MAQKRLSYLTRALVLKLKAIEPDRPLASIAQACGCSEQSARRILQAHTTDAKSLTRELLESGVLDRLDDWARASRISSAKGFHLAARDWLDAAGLSERNAPPAVQVDARPTIVVNIPFQLGAIAASPAPPAQVGPPAEAIDVHTRSLSPPVLTRDMSQD